MQGGIGSGAHCARAFLVGWLEMGVGAGREGIWYAMQGLPCWGWRVRTAGVGIGQGPKEHWGGPNRPARMPGP